MNNEIEASTKARRSACRRIGQPLRGLHSEAKISFHPFYKHCFTVILTRHVATATHCNDCNPPPRPAKAFVGTSPQPGRGLHNEAIISFHPFYKQSFIAIVTCHVTTATHYNDCKPPPRPGKALVSASPGLAEGYIVKQKFPSILFTNRVLQPFSLATLQQWHITMIAGLHQGQAKRLSVHRPARRRAAQWSENFLPSFLQT